MPLMGNREMSLRHVLTICHRFKMAMFQTLIKELLNELFLFSERIIFFTYLKSCKLHQMVDNLDTNSGTRLFLQGRDESSRREKRNKDDLTGRRNLKI